ncbi:MAG TPA: HAD family hydrolase, partial [bacterium]|nr:HAD family hydrolase [bacterium]
MNALFDLDGTLCDPREGIERGFRHAFDAVGLPFPGKDRIAAQIGRPLLDCFRALDCGEAGPEAARRFHEFFEARGFAEARLYDGALDCLRQLRREGWGLALASSKPTFAVRFVAEAMDLLPCLDGLYGCAPDDLSPDKRVIVGDALRGLAWDPSRTVLIGDREQDRDAAAATGLPFVAAAWGFGGP